ncbi:hypothetical protein OROMI_033844 [Orobanche minor]
MPSKNPYIRRMIKEFEREIKDEESINPPEVNKQLKDEMQSMIYRVSDMELVRILPIAEDEVNVACFHPLVGGGLVYGTKEGKLRIFQCDLSHGFNNEGSCVPDDNMLERRKAVGSFGAANLDGESGAFDGP